MLPVTSSVWSGRVLSAIVIFCIIADIHGQRPTPTISYYSIVSSKVLRPNSDYHVAVSVHNTFEPTTVVVEVGGRQDSGGPFKTTQFVTVEQYSTKIVQLQIGDIGSGAYNLTVQGSGGINFRNSSALEYVHKSYSVFIQTDKAIYKPGHKILFRTLVLSPSLKPVTTRYLDIYISDGNGNRVKQWKKQLTTQGIFSSEMQLSEYPVLGNWNITVNILDQEYFKTFEVAEYVLPKFQVTLNVPPHVTLKQSTIVATVHAKYTYGRAVKGEATVSAIVNAFSGVAQTSVQNAVIHKVVKIDGKADVEFDLVKELHLSSQYERLVTFEVWVEESLTGRRQNTTAQTLLHRHNYKMDFIKTAEYFKPGLKYTAFIKLSHHDGSPITDKTNPVKVRHYYSYSEEQYNETKHTLSSDGLVKLVYHPPATNASTIIRIEAEYLDIKEWIPPINAAVSPSNSFIQAFVKTENPTVNSDVEVEINWTTNSTYVSYEVIGRGDVITANTAIFQTPTTKATVRFLATSTMAPVAHFVTHFTRDDGEVVADFLDIELKPILQNHVNIKMDRDEGEPGSAGQFELEAKPYSYIGVLAVDESVLLLRNDNDLNKDAVLDELRSYDVASDTNNLPPFARDLSSAHWRPGSFTSGEAFSKSGTIIMTNGYVHEHFPWIHYRSNMLDESDLTVTADGNDLSSNSLRVRRFFPETWIWNIVETGNKTPTREKVKISTVKPDLGPPVVYRAVTRPPLAGPFAFSYIPTPVWNHPRRFLAHAIADTWLFSNFTVGFDGKASFKKIVPDTITSWVISAFSVDSVYGLGLLETPKKYKSFRSFFISLDLPYSVIRDEIIAIPVVIFNYLDRNLAVDVTLENVGQFEFADKSNDVANNPKVELYRKKKVNVKSNTGASTTFLIKPTALGNIGIKITANSPYAGDAIERKLLVKAEGETVYKNKAMFVDLRRLSSFERNITLDIPDNIVPGSEYVEASAIGDILGSSVHNLGNLIKMPYGCGEQNMLNFVPNIVILDYLKNSQQSSAATEMKCLNYLEIGYQQELTYRRNDGSFSAFGSADSQGSTWLTAFVAKSFRQASAYIAVQENIITDALRWLSENQATNGSFPEVGKVSHSAMQGGSARGLALTAYTLIAFLENSRSTSDYRNTISKAVEYIVKNLAEADDAYAYAICTYALHLAYHPQKDVAFEALQNKAEIDGYMMYWKRKGTDGKNPWTKVPNSVDVEMTSYAMLSYIHRGQFEGALPILNWLVTQQNREGGFASTQDTVIAIYALSKLAESISTSDMNMNVKIITNQSSNQIKIYRANSTIMYKHELPRKTKQAMITADGTGFAIVQISYRYNVNVTGEWPLFLLDPQVDKSSDKNHLQLSVCSSFVGGNKSNMAVMEISLPSGYTVDVDSLPSLQISHGVKRIEMKEDDTIVVLYFDHMTKEEVCPTISAFRTHRVAHQRPVQVIGYDYYDQTRRGRSFYQPSVANLCDICEGTDCEKVCSSATERIGPGNENPSSAAVIFTNPFLLLASQINILIFLSSR